MRDFRDIKIRKISLNGGVDSTAITLLGKIHCEIKLLRQTDPCQPEFAFTDDTLIDAWCIECDPRRQFSAAA